MAHQRALKTSLRPVMAAEGGYDEGLHERFVLWRDQSGTSVNRIAGMIGRSAAAVSQYANYKYEGAIPEIEKDIATLLRREEDLQFVQATRMFCSTQPSILLWEVLEYCDGKQKMGAALAASGIGKTETCREYKRRNRSSIFVTADISTRSVGSVLRLIAKASGGVPRRGTISDMLHAIIDRLKGSRRLIIIDDAHFLTWEAFEATRKIHDCAGIGIVYVGQERLYDQMRGATNRAYLFDQIYSRIAIKRDDFRVRKEDVRMLASSMWPGIDTECVRYLYDRARGKGPLRSMRNVIEVAEEIHRESGRDLGIDLLREAAGFLMV